MPELWERQPNESPKAFAAFVIYRDLGKLARSHTEVGRVLGKSRQLLSRWSSQHRWVERAEAYDRWVDEQSVSAAIDSARAEHLRKLEEFRVRNEQIGNALLAVSARMLNKIAQGVDSAQVEDLKPADLANWLRSLSAAAEMGSRLTAESLGVAKLLEQFQRQQGD